MPLHAPCPGMLVVVAASVVVALPSAAVADVPVLLAGSIQPGEPEESLDPDPSDPTVEAEERTDPTEIEPVSDDAPAGPTATPLGEVPTAPSSAPEDPDEAQADRDGRTLMAAGASLLGGSYFNMLTGGLTQFHTGSPAVGRRMFVPLVGPFFAAAQVDRVSLQIMLSVAGLAQLAGLTKLIIGGVRYARSVKTQPERALSLRLAPTPTGGGATLRYRF